MSLRRWPGSPATHGRSLWPARHRRPWSPTSVCGYRGVRLPADDAFTSPSGWRSCRDTPPTPRGLRGPGAGSPDRGPGRWASSSAPYWPCCSRSTTPPAKPCTAPSPATTPTWNIRSLLAVPFIRGAPVSRFVTLKATPESGVAGRLKGTSARAATQRCMLWCAKRTNIYLDEEQTASPRQVGAPGRRFTGRAHPPSARQSTRQQRRQLPRQTRNHRFVQSSAMSMPVRHPGSRGTAPCPNLAPHNVILVDLTSLIAHLRWGVASRP